MFYPPINNFLKYKFILPIYFLINPFLDHFTAWLPSALGQITAWWPSKILPSYLPDPSQIRLVTVVSLSVFNMLTVLVYFEFPVDLTNFQRTITLYLHMYWKCRRIPFDKKIVLLFCFFLLNVTKYPSQYTCKYRVVCGIDSCCYKTLNCPFRALIVIPNPRSFSLSEWQLESLYLNITLKKIWTRLKH